MPPFHEPPNLDALVARALEMATERAIAGAAPFAAQREKPKIAVGTNHRTGHVDGGAVV